MYLNQFVFPTEFARRWGRATKGLLSPNVAFFVGFALSVALCGALAALTDVLIEHPFLPLRDRRPKPPRSSGFGRPRQAAAADQPAS